MMQTGHRCVSLVRGYIRDAVLFDDNAAAGIGTLRGRALGKECACSRARSF
jgi:hypothetical protein